MSAHRTADRTHERRWKRFTVYAVVWIAAYQLVPAGPWWETAWQTGTGWVVTLVVVRAVRPLPFAERLPWWCFALGLWLHGGGIVVRTVLDRVAETTNTLTLADLWQLMLVPCCAGGLALIIRRRSRTGDRAALVEALTVAVGLGLLTWVFVIGPLAADTSTSAVDRAVRVAYPVGGLILLTLAMRLLRGGTRNASLWWMAGSLVTFLLGDLGWAVALGIDQDLLHHQWSVRGVQQIFLVAYCCFGVAALHPGAGELTRAAPVRTPHLGVPQLLLPAIGLMVAPAVLGYQALHGGVTDGGAVAIGSALLFVLVLVRMAQLLKQVERQSRQLREMARRDELTGLPNRRAWNEELPRALAQAARAGTSVAVAVLDLDHFTRFNDTYGHQAGDELLGGAAEAWRSGLRASDLLARYGGAEFVVLLPGSDANAAAIVLDRMQHTTPAGQSFSAGVATWDVTESPEQVVGRAEAALHEAKTAGRRRVTIASPPRALAGTR